MGIKELAYHQTPLGELVLRRRPEPRLGGKEVYEVKLGDEFLMSSLFTKSEIELAELALAQLDIDSDVIVGGLGLGYTADAVLRHKSVSSVVVVDRFEEVISWHQQGLVPLGKRISEDERCELIAGDFFEMALGGTGAFSERRYDAIIVDIDHSPTFHLDSKNADFYAEEGLSLVSKRIYRNGVFALWSNDPAENEFTARLKSVFGSASAHNIEFMNPYSGKVSVNSVYLGVKQEQ
ncbi:MAG: spermidine synthase [Pyrinomonadaceae bacterium]|nr:spermidine synthase [Pyrinomonadaceae bacterium]